MYIISRDRLNMDLDKPTLELMVSLLGVDAKRDDDNDEVWREKQRRPDFKRVYDRVREICRQLVDLGFDDILVIVRYISTMGSAGEILLFMQITFLACSLLSVFHSS